MGTRGHAVDAVVRAHHSTGGSKIRPAAGFKTREVGVCQILRRDERIEIEPRLVVPILRAVCVRTVKLDLLCWCVRAPTHTVQVRDGSQGLSLRLRTVCKEVL